jgi:uncharacterized protein DUF5916
MTEARSTVHTITKLALLVLLATLPVRARAADPQPGPPIAIARAAGPIALDGDLSDPGWQGAKPITQWYETNVGDNVEPQVKNVAYLTYDDKFFYAGFQFEDPNPKGVRAPIGDHDNISGNSDDYAGVIVDSRNDGKTAQMFLSNPAGVQYDAQTSDATGEDSSPDFFWDAVGKITATGWNLEIRIPFSSLRYSTEAQPTWGILLYRNYPRDRRYQFFSARLPRDVNCFICNSSKMTGLANLPHGSHLVLAPFATATETNVPKDDRPGHPLLSNPLTPFAGKQVLGDAGVDLKWAPSSAVVIDGTVNPDFSQVESDAAQITANERFALFFQEKRPFFLEGVDLLSTPITAVYTRTITAPNFGGRVTGKVGSTAYTALGAQDDGGGLVVVPGPLGSDFALQDFRSDVGVFRARRDMGRSFISLLATERNLEEGNAYNFVIGPDFQWRPRGADSFTGQALLSEKKTPNRPDLFVQEWDGRTLDGHAAQLAWSHSTPKFDWYLQGQEFDKDFRDDNGFVPQVGYREIYNSLGYTIRPKKSFFSRVRFFSDDYHDAETDGTQLNQRISVGAGMDGRYSSFLRIELNRDNALVTDPSGNGHWLQRFRPHVVAQMSPNRVLGLLYVEAFVGDEIDFANAREGNGATILTTLALRPNSHLELRGNSSVRWLSTKVGGDDGRLFVAQVERLRATYSFTARSFLRLIGQYDETKRDLTRYDPILVPFLSQKNAGFSSSALFAYKLNWQTVLYAGYGDSRTFTDLTGQLEPSSRQVFTKISYAWQQ